METQRVKASLILNKFYFLTLDTASKPQQLKSQTIFQLAATYIEKQDQFKIITRPLY